MWNFCRAGLAASAFAIPMTAQAQSVDGFYVSLGAGVSIMQNSTKLFGYAPLPAIPTRTSGP